MTFEARASRNDKDGGAEVVFLWFGLLEFAPDMSLAGRTIEVLTFGLIEPSASVVMLARREAAIRLVLVTGRCLRANLLLLLLGTLTQQAFFPAETFACLPYARTLEG